MQNKPMTSLLRISSLAFFLAMGGCAVMDKSDCFNANWQGLGTIDALTGKNIFPAREESCRKHGVSADKSAYDRGVQQGLIGFCTAASGRHHGQGGGEYRRGFCPSNTEAEFLSGYTPAYEKYKFQQRIMDLQSQISRNDELLKAALDRNPQNSRDIERLRSEIQRLKKELQMSMYLRVLD